MKEKLQTTVEQPAATGRESQPGIVASSVLVAGLGDAFLGDDGFGVEVTRRLQEHELPSQVTVTDCGIRSFDLANALNNNYDAVILINAVPRGEKPGTLFVIEPNLEELSQSQSQELLPEYHGVNSDILAMLQEIAADPFKQLIVVGCEPVTTHPGSAPGEFSTPVSAAFDEAVEIVECLIAEMVGEALPWHDN